MHLIYRAVNGNAAAVQWLTDSDFRGRSCQIAKHSNVREFRVNGSFYAFRCDVGGGRCQRMPSVKEAALLIVEDNTATSERAVEQVLDVSN